MKQFSNSRQPAEQSKTEGIVINISNYSEKDLILKVLTEEFGKISVFFRGAKNIKKNIPDLFDSGEFTLNKKSSSMYYFANFTPSIRFKSFREDPNKLVILSVIAEVHDRLLPESEGSSKEIFSALHTTLIGLENCGDIKSELRLLHLCLLSILDNTGFGVDNAHRTPSMNNLLKALGHIEDQISGSLKSLGVLKDEVLEKLV